MNRDRDALYASVAFCAIGLIANLLGCPAITYTCGLLALVFGIFWLAVYLT